MDILSAAFREDPFTSWLSSKPGFQPMMMKLMVPLFTKRDLAYMTDQEDGVALWLKPGNKLRTPHSPIKMCRFILSAGWPFMPRFDALIKATKDAHPKEPHYYLFMIGKHPDATRRGVGSELMQHILNRCDAEGVLAYLENSNEKNLPFYEKHGFMVQSECIIGKNGPKLWLMTREPNQERKTL